MTDISQHKPTLAWMPAVRWMRAYDRDAFRVDLLAGLALAAFVIPESIAYASLAQLPPVTGLYCYLVAGIAYALFGTSRQLAVGPTSALAVVIATSVAAMGGCDPARAIALGSALALTVGIISVTGRYVGLANAAYFISDPILTGFKAGAGLYIASTQLPKLFGIEGVSGNFFERVWHVVRSLPQTHIPSLLVGIAAIALFIVLQRPPARPADRTIRGRCGDHRHHAVRRDGHPYRRRAAFRPAPRQPSRHSSVRHRRADPYRLCLFPAGLR